MPRFSIIVPVYNRPDEVRELLDSVDQQEFRDFEVLVVEDGSSIRCIDVVEAYKNKFKTRYFYKDNSGPGDTRNYGMKQAEGAWLLIFDSDAILPKHYLSFLDEYIQTHEIDAFGGPDKAHPDFNELQKAISHTMTSLFTTGGIRGRKKALEKFNPRSFNMGLKKEVFEATGGYPNIMLAEDTDLAIRMHKAGYKVVLIPECFVYHKRRVSFKKFFRQVKNFGYGRILLTQKYPDTFRPFFLFPTAFFIFLILSMLSTLIFWKWWLLAPLLFYLLLIFSEALIVEKNLKVATLSIWAAICQLCGYGFGFLKGFWEVVIMKDSKYLSQGTDALKNAQ